MRRAVTNLMLVFAVGTVLLVASGAAVAAIQVGAAAGAPGPRFLLASGTHAEPVRVDVRRTPLLHRQVSLRLDNATPKEALTEISRQAGLDLVYGDDILPAAARVSLQAERISVAAALTEVLINAGVDVVFTPHGRATLVPQPPALPEVQEVGTITGRVTNAETDEPVVNAQVAVDGRGRVLTDSDGRYRIDNVAPGLHTVTVTLIGYQTMTRQVEVPDGDTVSVDFVLEVSPTALEGIVVTGSRIRRAEAEGPSPVTVVSRQDIERAGRATVADALATLPQNFAPPFQSEIAFNPARVDLRGMGSDNTLVLVNGRRAANSGMGPNSGTTFVDLNSIPLSAVERIEVLTDGASAVYGSDAVAGVVNIVLKEEFRGTEVSVNYGTSEGGASEQRVGLTAGGARAGLRGLLTGEYFNRGSLAATDRAFTSGDNRARGGRDLRSTFSHPGNVSSLDGENLPGLDAPEAGIPAGQDGRNLTPADFAATARELNHDRDTRDLISPSERWGLSGQGSWALRSELALFAEAGFSHTTNDRNGGFPTQRVTVPASNPFNPFGQDVRVDWLATELDPLQIVSETDNLRALLGLEGRLAGGWAWETSLSHSRDDFDVPGIPFVPTALVNELLSRTDPAAALNVFGDGAGANTPAVLDELKERSDRLSIIGGAGDMLNWEGQLNGVLARWAGRELRVAVGAEYREESMDWKQLDVFPPAPPVVSGRVTGDRQVAAGFAELALPLFGREHQRPGVRALELQLAGRWESYSDFGNTFSPHLAVRWQPIHALALRASAGTGFRAPALRELFQPGFEIPDFSVTDPRRNDETASVVLRIGGNPELRPETSENWNVGLVWDVPGLRGLSLSMDGYGLQQDEAISDGSFLRTEHTAELEALFLDRYRRAEPTPEDLAAGLPGRLLEIDASEINVSQVTVRGVDLGVNYVNDSAAGRFDLQVNGAYIDRLAVQLNPFLPVEQVAGTTSSGLAGVGSPVRFRANAALFWSRGAWDVGATERYTGAPRETAQTESPTLGQRLDDHFETDLQLNFRFPGASGPLSDTRLSLGVQNVFDQEPPFRDVERGYNGLLYGPRQRFAQLTLTKGF